MQSDDESKIEHYNKDSYVQLYTFTIKVELALFSDPAESDYWVEVANFDFEVRDLCLDPVWIAPEL